MTLTLEDRLLIEAELENIYKAIPSHSTEDRDQVREYIDVGEYGLALDDMACIYLESKSPLQPEIRALFERLAIKMEMRSGDLWGGVAKIRAA